MPRNIFWKGNSNYGVHLIDWDKITKPKNLGGLGNQKEREANTSMLSKLVWSLYLDCDSSWLQVLKHKHISEEMFLNVKNKLGSVTWNAIMKSLSAFKDGFEFRLRDGNSTFLLSNWFVVWKLAEQILYMDIYDLEIWVNDVYLDEN